jgi:hypothetical protein
MSYLVAIYQVRKKCFARSEPQSSREGIAQLHKFQAVDLVDRGDGWLAVAFWDHATGKRQQGWVEEKDLRYVSGTRKPNGTDPLLETLKALGKLP